MSVLNEPAGMILLYAVIPLWLLSGLADWWCHRRTHIEHTSGVKESLLHLLMFAEGGLALLFGLFLEINALILAIFLLLLIVHELTGIWDLEYAVPRRDVRTSEQHVHSFLEVTPFLAMSLICVLHWHQFIALFGMGLADFSLRWKQQPLPVPYVAGVLAIAILCVFAVYIEELYRCCKARNAVSR